jgi:hypothetical protein
MRRPWGSGVSFAFWLARASAPFASANLGLNYGRVDAVGEALVRAILQSQLVGLWLGCSSIRAIGGTVSAVTFWRASLSLCRRQRRFKT